MNTPRIIEVKADDEGQRLDRWLKRVAPDLPYVLVQKLVRKGQIRIDGKRAKTDTRIGQGQEVRLPPFRSDGKRSRNPSKPTLSDKDIAFMRRLVLYEDADLIALNKPAGLATQGGSKIKRSIDGMLEALADKDGVRPRLVHRLDKDTSGVLLLAKSAKAAKACGEVFRGRDVKKIYWAIVTPTPEMMNGTIKAPLLKGGPKGQEKVHVDYDNGKYAQTEFSVIEQAHKRAAFVAFWPRTGRTHQIRVHAQIAGFPVLGDGKYGGQGAFIEGLDHPKILHLHARRLILKHPLIKSKTVDVSAPLPSEMKQSFKRLGFNTKDTSDPFKNLAV
jgi:23S rRNA pseudouridine955/2504/2580 synthase